MKLASVRLISDQAGAVAAFYGRLIGVEPAGGPAYTEVPTERGVIAIASREAMSAGGQPVRNDLSNSSAIIEFEVEDVDDVRTRLDGAADEVVQEPTDQPWGNRSMLLRDPDGTMVNVYSAIVGADRLWPSQET